MGYSPPFFVATETPASDSGALALALAFTGEANTAEPPVGAASLPVSDSAAAAIAAVADSKTPPDPSGEQASYGNVGESFVGLG